MYKPLTLADRARFASNHGKLVQKRIGKHGQAQVTGNKQGLRQSQWGSHLLHTFHACLILLVAGPCLGTHVYEWRCFVLQMV